jgi:hypothetical protein
MEAGTDFQNSVLTWMIAHKYFIAQKVLKFVFFYLVLYLTNNNNNNNNNNNTNIILKKGTKST